MKDLSNFRIGSQCENICKELTNFKNGEPVDQGVIDTSLEIISFCLNMCNGQKVKSLSFMPARERFLPLIVQLYRNKSKEDIKKSFESVLESIQFAKNNKHGDVASAITFFYKIEKICLNNSIYNHPPVLI